MNPVEWLEEGFNKTWKKWGRVYMAENYKHYYLDSYAFFQEGYRRPGAFMSIKEDE